MCSPIGGVRGVGVRGIPRVAHCRVLRPMVYGRSRPKPIQSKTPIAAVYVLDASNVLPYRSGVSTQSGARALPMPQESLRGGLRQSYQRLCFIASERTYDSLYAVGANDNLGRYLQRDVLPNQAVASS